jgi:nucleoside-diphosphate-sugar epimerase
MGFAQSGNSSLGFVAMRVLIIGCGYVGLPLAAELAAAGHTVFGLQRTPDDGELARHGVTPVIADIVQPATLRNLPSNLDWVVNTVSSSKGGVEEYRRVYLDGTRHLIARLGQPSLRKYICTSSTSVYGQTDGEVITEGSPTQPQSETSRILVETEQLLASAARQSGFPAVTLRVAGIYGPERGHLFQQYLRGEARLDGDGLRLLNMIHRDDVIRAIVSALERGVPGQVYNVADDEPVTQREFFSWLSDQLHMPMPPSADPLERATRKRGVTNKRVSNRKLRLELNCELKYPTFRQGYSAEIARLQAAGKGPVGPG